MKPSRLAAFFVGRFLTTVSISFVDIGLFLGHFFLSELWYFVFQEIVYILIMLRSVGSGISQSAPSILNFSTNACQMMCTICIVLSEVTK